MSILCFMNNSACHRAGILALALSLAPFLAKPAGAQTTGKSVSITIKAPKVSDPGPRPVGNQSITVNGVILNTGVVDFLQPMDANGNGAGRQLGNITPDQTAAWFTALEVFGLPATVNGAIDPITKNPSIVGLGPAFNGNSCFMCHSFPTIGGSSPPVNPQVAVATASGARNSQPPFIVLNGPRS
ncbi:MAG: hypothetical protein WDN46_11165 [Methylocella sp.]